jgi:hypothetical protein
MKGMLMLLAAMLVGWATLAAPSLAAPSDNASINLEACCPHHGEMDCQNMAGAMKVDQPCESESGCSSPDCTITSGSVTALAFEAGHLAAPDPGLEIRNRLAPARPHNIALAIPKQPPRI